MLRRPILKPFDKDRFELMADYEFIILCNESDKFVGFNEGDRLNLTHTLFKWLRAFLTHNRLFKGTEGVCAYEASPLQSPNQAKPTISGLNLMIFRATPHVALIHCPTARSKWRMIFFAYAKTFASFNAKFADDLRSKSVVRHERASLGLGFVRGRGRPRNSSPLPLAYKQFDDLQNQTLKPILIKKGYKTNGANIPRIFWSIFPPNYPEYLTASLIHDYLTDEAVKGAVSFKFADMVLKTAMQDLGCNKFKVLCFYYCCRAYHLMKYGD